MTSKLTIKVILTALTIVVFATSSQRAFGNEDPNAKLPNAKEQGAAQDRIKNRVEELGKELNLTEQQKKDIMPVLENEMNALLPVMTDKSLTREQMQEKIKTIRETTKDRMGKILTPEQMKKYAEKKTNAQENGQDRRVDRIIENLNLTEQQKKDVEPILKNEMKVLMPIMTDKSLTKEQKMEKINAIRQTTKELLSKKLTTEQMKKYDEIDSNPRDEQQQFTARHIERMSEKLNLTEQQKKDVAPIIENEMKQVRAVMNETSLNKEQKLKKIDSIHLTTKEQLSRFLTPQQQKKYADEIEDRPQEKTGENNGTQNKNGQKPADSNSK